MNFGKRTAADEADRIIRRALEHGIRLFDTANVYNDGESERILGRALARERSSVRIASKVGLGRAEGDKVEGLTRQAIARAIDATLSRLGTDYVDLYYLHAPDHATPIEETLDAVAGLLREKRIRGWGVSNYSAWQILEMNALADARGIARPSTSQVIYNLLIREIEVEYLAFAKRFPIHTTVYNPLAGGLLSGKHRYEAEAEKGSRFDGNRMYRRRYWSKRMFDHVEALAGVAEAESMSLVDLAYAWVASRPGVSSILVGPVTVDHLDAAVAACGRTVSPEGLARIDAIHGAHAGTDTHYVR